MKENYNKTIHACFIGYVVQAIVNNFVPLLFLTFQKEYGIALSKITFLITVNFCIQLCVDFLAAGFIDKIGYRVAAVIAHVFAAAGFVLLTVLPQLCSDAYVGIMISVCVYAVGGGLLEVLVSPIVEACPTDNKEQTMSLLHSFYSWGYVGVVLISSLFFTVIGISHWKILAVLWAIVPIANAIFFTKVPIASLQAEDEEGLPIRTLIKKKTFWVLMLMMLCAGASEHAVAQWASVFAEKGLGVSKAVGDLAGPMSFAVLMGVSRVFYGKYGDRIDLDRFMIGSGFLCVLAYLGVAFIPSPVFGLLSCALCGLAVGIMWPGTFSKATAALPGGGASMFALLAFAGDLGCAGGPTLAGTVSAALGNDLKKGILSAIVFPALLLFGCFKLKRQKS